MSVMDALARAGSPTAAAGTYVVINRRPRADEAASRPGGQPESEKVSMAELLSGRAQSILLSDGDTIFVPKAETFYVTGYVKHPGPYLLSSEVTIAQAVAMAGGITERGSRNRFRVTRTVEGKQAVLKNVKPGDLVRPGDSIEVLPRFF
jgi:polysaccharide export outer membrane protein